MDEVAGSKLGSGLFGMMQDSRGDNDRLVEFAKVTRYFGEPVRLGGCKIQKWLGCCLLGLMEDLTDFYERVEKYIEISFEFLVNLGVVRRSDS